MAKISIEERGEEEAELIDKIDRQIKAEQVEKENGIMATILGQDHAQWKEYSPLNAFKNSDLSRSVMSLFAEEMQEFESDEDETHQYKELCDNRTGTGAVADEVYQAVNDQKGKPYEFVEVNYDDATSDLSSDGIEKLEGDGKRSHHLKPLPTLNNSGILKALKARKRSFKQGKGNHRDSYNGNMNGKGKTLVLENKNSRGLAENACHQDDIKEKDEGNKIKPQRRNSLARSRSNGRFFFRRLSAKKNVTSNDTSKMKKSNKNVHYGQGITRSRASERPRENNKSVKTDNNIFSGILPLSSTWQSDADNEATIPNEISFGADSEKISHDGTIPQDYSLLSLSASGLGQSMMSLIVPSYEDDETFDSSVVSASTYSTSPTVESSSSFASGGSIKFQSLCCYK